LCLMINKTYCQEGSVFSFGVGNISFEENNELPFAQQSVNKAYVAYELISENGWSAKVFYTTDLNIQESSYWDLGLGFTYMLKLTAKDSEKKGSLLSFPISFSGAYYDLNGANDKSYGNLRIGVEVGVRLYVTRKIAINGTIGRHSNIINRIDEEEFMDSIGSILNNRISLGISYFIN